MGTLHDRIRAEAAEADTALAQLAAASVPPTPPANDIPPAPTGEIPPAPPAPPAPTAAPIDAAAFAALQHRLSSLEGMYNGVVAEREQLTGRVDQMTRLLASGNRQPAPAPAAPAPTPAPSLVTEAERTEFGEEFLDVSRRVALQTLMPTINGLIRRIEQLEAGQVEVQQLASSAHTAASSTLQKTFEQELTELVPDWPALNTNPGFLDYLKKPDIFSDKSRHELLQQAVESGSAERVARFFTAYKSEIGTASPAPSPTAPTPAPATPPAPAPAPVPQPTVDVRHLIAPSPAAPAPAHSNPQNGRTWTSADIEKVYDDKMKGRITAQDFANLEGQIFKAFEEGRIQP